MILIYPPLFDYLFVKKARTVLQAVIGPFAIRNALIAVLAVSGLTMTVQANVITLSADQASGKDWNDATAWSDEQAPVNTKDYSNNGYLLRTPNNPSGSSTFAGKTLTVEGRIGGSGGSGTLALKTGTVTINELKINSGAIVNSAGLGQTAYLKISNLLVGSNTENSPAGLSGNNGQSALKVNIDTLSGSGWLALGSGGPAVGNGADKTLSVANGTGFEGTLVLQKGKLTLGSHADLKRAVFVMKNSSSLILGAADACNLTVKTFSYNNTELPAGTYTAVQLNSHFGATDVFSGNGTVTVIASAVNP